MLAILYLIGVCYLHLIHARRIDLSGSLDVRVGGPGFVNIVMYKKVG